MMMMMVRCGMEGHIAVNCPRARRGFSRGRSPSREAKWESSPAGRGGWFSDRFDRALIDEEICLNCKRPGHVFRDCPNEIVCNKWALASGVFLKSLSDVVGPVTRLMNVRKERTGRLGRGGLDG